MIAESYGKSRLSCAKNCQTIFLSGHFALPLTMRRVPIPFTFQDVMTYYFENAHIVLFWGLFCFVLFCLEDLSFPVSIHCCFLSDFIPFVQKPTHTTSHTALPVCQYRGAPATHCVIQASVFSLYLKTKFSL